MNEVNSLLMICLVMDGNIFMTCDWNITLVIIVLVLVVIFGVLAHFTLKMEDMEIKSTGFKLLRGIIFAATVAVGLTLVILMRQNTDIIMDIMHRQ